MHGPMNIKSYSTYYAVLSAFLFTLNFVIEGFNECTTIYSQKKNSQKSCRKRKYSCFKHVHEMICDDLSDEWISIFFSSYPREINFYALKMSRCRMETSKRLTLTVRCSYAPWQVFGRVAERKIVKTSKWHLNK